MAEHYQFNLDPQQPSSEEIARHRDFDALMEAYHNDPAPPNQPSFRRLRLLRIAVPILAVAAVGLAVLYFITSTEDAYVPLDEPTFYAQRPFIDAPIPAARPQLASYTLDGQQGGEIRYPSGSRLVIPAVAFHDDYGRQVQGDVQIRYREMHDPVDFFLSGIPMYYDSAGVRYNLESAGMMELYAEQNGQRLRLAPGKTIDVELVSSVHHTGLDIPRGYNIYYLDTAKRQWVYRTRDQMTFLPEKNYPADHPAADAQRIYQQALANADQWATSAMHELERAELPPEPLPPHQPTAHTPTFELDFVRDITAASREYAGTIWQPAPGEDTERAISLLQRNWVDAKLLPTRRGVYALELIDAAGATSTLDVQPVLIAEDFARAQAQYESERAAYLEALQSHQSTTAEQRAEIFREQQARRAQAATTYQQALDNAGVDPPEDRQVMNRFTATHFGIWNCDRPILPQEHTIKASFRSTDGKVLHGLPAYLVDKSRNTLYRFVAQEQATLSFNTRSEHLLWVVLPDGRIAVADPSAFADIPAEAKSHTFQLQLRPRVPQNKQQMRQLLEI